MISVTAAGADHRVEDSIVGAMIRQVLSFEGQAFDDRTVATITAVVEIHARHAESVGLSGDWVREVAKRMTVTLPAHVVTTVVSERVERLFQGDEP